MQHKTIAAGSVNIEPVIGPIVITTNHQAVTELPNNFAINLSVVSESKTIGLVEAIIIITTTYKDSE